MPGARIALVLALALAVFGLAGCGGGGEADSTDTETTAEPTVAVGSTLHASVGPGFEISLTTDAGDDVTTLAAGEYTVDVDDKASAHNFHLTGPGGVDEDSGVNEIGSSTWTVTFEDGSYHYQCDPHASQMNGDFEVTG
jgi:plastocyanin